jgi:tRNA dimethylallyltransferase
MLSPIPTESPNHAQDLPPLVVVLGPTAVGKTEIAIQLAERLHGEIISVDSRLFYRGMEIGTAKPSAQELQRVPHHLIDIVDPEQSLSLAVFQSLARSAISEIRQRGHLPFLVGGTGQYLRAVTERWLPPAVMSSPRLREALQNWGEAIGAQALHQRLALIDPIAAQNIDYRNLRRTIRAIEVIFSTGQRFSTQRRRGPLTDRVLQIGLTRPRPELYQRIDVRIEAMFRAGFVDEVRRLLAAGYPPDLPAFSAIGYREVIAHLQGQIPLAEVEQEIRRATRMYVRRQANWFKPDDPAIHWFMVGENTVAEIEFHLRAWLNRME